MRLALFHPSDRALKALFFAAAVAIGLALLATSPTFAQEPTVGIQTSTSPPTPLFDQGHLVRRRHPGRLLPQ